MHGIARELEVVPVERRACGGEVESQGGVHIRGEMWLFSFCSFFLVFVFIFPLVLFACVFGEYLQMARARCNVAPAAPPDGRIKDLSSGRSSSIASIQPSSCATCSKNKEESGLVYATFHMAKMGSSAMWAN